ncbi:unnamed protein product (macronuclear) [Paramecium tetraurelia]|uniref:Casein kinase I n=1 Tax=Paramecium tetraurelia TaxID=5888 RepID=A0CAU0_PARTE|nr:uncharacterized protein GSPATT00036688001 [Paramecium tetraurelia]CAK67907.1 unnamed protein product [Paramecium tetraurelia]|eukprot:XP_001435304.1 hypothetical protein (macronuclear) [Paramecium tetraurelia strain d4-2]
MEVFEQQQKDDQVQIQRLLIKKQLLEIRIRHENEKYEETLKNYQQLLQRLESMEHSQKEYISQMNQLSECLKEIVQQNHEMESAYNDKCKEYEILDSEAEEAVLKAGDIIQGRFRIGELLGEGSFGSVFRIYDIQNSNEVFAIKVEQELEEEESMLEREIKIMMELKKKPGFPQILYYGQENHYVYYIMNVLGPNLEITSKKCGGSFTLVTMLRLAIQMLSRIETLHSMRLIHRDIKPDNFVLGLGQQQNILHLIDFGLSKFYVNSKGEHIKQVRKKGLIGTARYASINAHNELEQSRRDDLESIAYILVYLATGSLPWMNLQIEQKDLKYAKILHLKKSTTPEIVCKNLPACFMKFLTAVRKLDFITTPDYGTYKKLFQSELEKHQVQPYYDWEVVGDNHTKKKSNTMHIMPEQLKQNNSPNNLHIINSNGNNNGSNKNTMTYGQDQIIEGDMDKRLNLQASTKGVDNKQFERFEQILQQNQKKYYKMNSSKRQNSGRAKTPVMVNVIEPDKQIQQQQYEQVYDEVQYIAKSAKFLQPPSTPNVRNSSSIMNPYYIPSLNTSQVNNYDWSEGEEISNEGTPLWCMYVEKERQNVMTGIQTKKKNSIKHNSFSALQYPIQNQVRGSDEELFDIE